MTPFLKTYTLVWLTLCFCSAVLYFQDRRAYAFSHQGYWRFLLKPWKVVTFIIAAIFMIGVAPYSGDYTWDYVDAGLISLLTFITAPWAVAILYRFREGKAAFRQAFVAFCLWMFSASWSYDIYMFFREGEYPPTWLPNIVLSSILYACAGLLWNLDWREEKGIVLSFIEDNWPIMSKGIVFHKIFLATLPFIFIVVLLCGLVIYQVH